MIDRIDRRQLDAHAILHTHGHERERERERSSNDKFHPFSKALYALCSCILFLALGTLTHTLPFLATFCPPFMTAISSLHVARCRLCGLPRESKQASQQWPRKKLFPPTHAAAALTQLILQMAMPAKRRRARKRAAAVDYYYTVTPERKQEEEDSSKRL